MSASDTTSTPRRRKVDWRPLPPPHERVRVNAYAYRLLLGEMMFLLDARGQPEDLVAAGLALPEWVPVGRKGAKNPPAPDGSLWNWQTRSPKAAIWCICRRTDSLEVARRWPGAPTDFKIEDCGQANPPAAPATTDEFRALFLSSFGMHVPSEMMDAGTADRLGFAFHEKDLADFLQYFQGEFRMQLERRVRDMRIVARRTTNHRVLGHLSLVVDNTKEAPR